MEQPAITLEEPPPTSRLFSQTSMWWVVIGVLIVGFLVAPFTQNEFDVQTCLGWARASGGWQPWKMYALRPDCNYPPVTLYALTLIQAILNAAGAGSDSSLAIFLIKVPNLIALGATAWLVRWGLKPLWGLSAASATACVCALCFPLWFDAAVWGQWEAFLCLAMVGAVIGLLRERPLWSGIAMGFGLSVKPLAVMILPAMLVYCVRRFGFRAVARLILGAALAWAMLAAPFFAAGAGQGVRQSYVDTVGRYSLFSVGAFNVWMFLQTCGNDVRNWPSTFGQFDSQTVLGPITAKQMGLVIFSLYLAFVLLGLWQRPTRYNFIFAAGLSAFAIFMLPTEMHERYALLAAVLFALISLRGKGWIYLAIALAATINQVIALPYEYSQGRGALTAESYHAFQTRAMIFSAINVVLLLWITWRYARETLGRLSV